MNLQAIVDAIFAGIEAQTGNHPLLLAALKWVNKLIDDYLAANPNPAPGQKPSWKKL